MSFASAIIYNKINQVQYYLQRGVDVNDYDEFGYTPLIESCIAEHPHLTELLLKAGADPNLKDITGNSALHWAVENNNEAQCQLLLQHGADANAYTEAAEPAISKAMLRNQTRLREILVQHGADASFGEDYIMTKLLAHRFSLVGRNYIVTPKKRFVEVDLEGFILEFTLNVAQMSLQMFKHNFAARPFKQFAPYINQISTALGNAAELLKYQQYRVNIAEHEATIEHLLKNDLLILPVGYSGHAITFVKCGHWWALCDRGEQSINNFSVVISRIGNRQLANPDFYKALLYKKHGKSTIEFGVSENLGLEVMGHFSLPSQISGNCAWANVAASIPAALMLLTAKQQSLLSLQPLDKSKAAIYDFFQAWQTWDQQFALHQMLESFGKASPERKASKAILLAKVLYEWCQHGVPQDIERASRILKILNQPKYNFILKTYLRRFTQERITAAGQNLLELMDLCA